MNHHELVTSYLDAFASGDPEQVASHVTDDFRNVQVGELGDGCEGRDSYRQRLTTFLADFHGLRYAIDKLIVDGNDVAASYTMHFEQAGREFEIQGVMIITVRNGLIAVREDYWDGLSYQKQAAT